MLHNPSPGSGPFPTGDRTLAVLPSERKMAEARGHAPLPASAGRSGFKPVPILDRFDSLRSPSGSTSGRSISASLRRLQWSPRQAQHATHAERRTEGAGRSPEFRVAKRVNRTCVGPFRRRMPDQLFAVQPCWAPARLTPHPLRGVGAAPSPRCSAPSATRRNGPRARTPTGSSSHRRRSRSGRRRGGDGGFGRCGRGRGGGRSSCSSGGGRSAARNEGHDFCGFLPDDLKFYSVWRQFVKPVT